MNPRTSVRPNRLADRWWTLAAPGYDRAVGLVGWHRWQDLLVADLACGPVLDVGCGPAHLAHGLLARGVDYVGVDRNAAMLARARRLLAECGPGRGTVVRADIGSLPFPDGAFAVVVSTGVLGLLDVPHRRRVLHEMARVARTEVRLLEPIRRPGGAFRARRSRVVAFLRDRPIDLDDLADAGLRPELLGPARLLEVYSMARAGKH